MYTKHILPINALNAVSIIRWNVAGAFLSSKGIRLKWKCPSGVENAVYFFDASSIGIW